MASSDATIDYNLSRGAIQAISTGRTIYAAGSGVKEFAYFVMPFAGHILQVVEAQICLLGSFDCTALTIGTLTSTTPTFTAISDVEDPPDTEGYSTTTIDMTTPATEYARGTLFSARITMAATITLEVAATWIIVPAVKFNNPN